MITPPWVLFLQTFMWIIDYLGKTRAVKTENGKIVGWLFGLVTSEPSCYGGAESCSVTAAGTRHQTSSRGASSSVETCPGVSLRLRLTPHQDQEAGQYWQVMQWTYVSWSDMWASFDNARNGKFKTLRRHSAKRLLLLQALLAIWIIKRPLKQVV